MDCRATLLIGLESESGEPPRVGVAHRPCRPTQFYDFGCSRSGPTIRKPFVVRIRWPSQPARRRTLTGKYRLKTNELVS